MGLENKLRLAFMNLEGEISPGEIFRYFTKDNALKILKKMTNQDFGYDIEAWRRWINENRPGILTEEDNEPDSPHRSEEGRSTRLLTISYLNYLKSGLGSKEAEKLVIALEQNKLELESHALRIFLTEGSGAKFTAKSWKNRVCTVSLGLPENSEPGDIWFDPIELNMAILIPNPEGISHHVKSWISTHPVYAWQYQAFLNLVKVGKKLDAFSTPDDYLTQGRTQHQASLKYVTNLYQDEALAYSSWMRKSLCGQVHLNAARAYLGSTELSRILPTTLKLWESGEFQEDYRTAVGLNSISKNPSLDYDDIIDENYDELESQPDRMLYEEWDCRSNIGMLTKVSAFTGLSEGHTTETFHFQLLNRSPEPLLSPIS
jgi:hypothetical protein